MRWNEKTIVLCLLVVAVLMSFRYQLTPYRFPVSDTLPPLPVNPGNPVSNEGVTLGRYLFYDPLLSSDSTMACSSCHKLQSAFGDGQVALSPGRQQHMSRNTPGLFNLAWHPALFWDGRASGIEDQVLHPVRTASEMNLNWTDAAARIRASSFYRNQFAIVFGAQAIDSTLIAKALGQFLRALVSYRSKYDRVVTGDDSFTRDEYEGFLLINDQTRGDCQHCHITDGDGLATTYAYSNNGLDNIIDPSAYKDKGRGGMTGLITDNGKFKIPSLRNLAFTAPYMHDGRYKTLTEVIDFYSDSIHYCANIDSKMGYARRGGAHLTSDEKKKVLAFLYTMSDSAFVKDSAFSNPFTHRK